MSPTHEKARGVTRCVIPIVLSRDGALRGWYTGCSAMLGRIDVATGLHPTTTVEFSAYCQRWISVAKEHAESAGSKRLDAGTGRRSMQ